jgi:ribosomal protein S18
MIDFRDVLRLRRFISDWAKIEPRRKSGTCAPHQRALATAIKRARQTGLLPFTGTHSLLDLARPEPFRGDRDRNRPDRRERYSEAQTREVPSGIVGEVQSSAPVNGLPQGKTEIPEQGETSSLTENEVNHDTPAVDDIPVVAEAPPERVEGISSAESSEVIIEEDSERTQEQMTVSNPTKQKPTKA